MMRLVIAVAPGLIVTLLTWAAGAGAVEPVFLAASDSSFSRPHDLVLSPDGRQLFVADVGNDAVKVLDPDTLVTLGVVGRGELSGPHDLAFDPQGRLVVADSGNDRIAIFELRETAGAPGGALVGVYDAELGSPEGVAVAADGTIYISNARRHDLVAVRDGVVIARIGGSGSGDNRYRRPHDVELDAQGRVYAVDPGNNRIQILTSSLEFVAALAGAPFDFNEPKYLAFDARGWLYVADENNNQVKIFDRDHKPLATIGSGPGPDRLNKPEGVTARGDRVWVSDTYNHRILLYRLEDLP